MTSHAAMRVNYDDLADTLYVSIEDRAHGRYREDNEHEGVVWRLASDGHEYGVTVMDFREVWAGRTPNLARLIADHLRLQSASVERLLERAS